MPLPRDEAIGGERRRPGAADRLYVWNRKLHYYLGLYFLFFAWLFAFTGLILNHPRWEFAQFWPNRVQSTAERQFHALGGDSDFDRASDLMQQLGIAGEIQWPSAQPSDGPMTFQVTRPGLIIDVSADLVQGRATLRRNELNGWGVMQLLHTFTGVRDADARNTRDWMLTTMWAWSMDALAAGLIAMVLSSYVMWWRLPAKRRLGVVAVLFGVATCAAFVTSVRWLF